MLTSQVESAANRGDLATADFDIQLVLRSNVIPAFLEDVGRIGWRWRGYQLTTVPGQQSYTLPEDFFEMQDVWVVSGTGVSNVTVNTGGDSDPLPFIGEDPYRVAAALANVANYPQTQYRPLGYFLQHDVTDPNRWAIWFQAPPDGTYTLWVLYYWIIPFADSSQDVDLRKYLPEQYHWALVELLRREIIDDRYGQGDQRYATSDAKYQAWLARIAKKRELAKRGDTANYMR